METLKDEVYSKLSHILHDIKELSYVLRRPRIKNQYKITNE